MFYLYSSYLQNQYSCISIIRMSTGISVAVLVLLVLSVNDSVVQFYTEKHKKSF